MDPLYAELEAAQAREQIEASHTARAQQDVADATRQARADLESQIDTHPLVLAAEKKAAPFYRKGQLIGV